MSTVLLAITDGRGPLLEQTLRSAEAMLPPVDRHLMVDDTADPHYGAWLDTTFPTFEIIHQPARSGFGGAITAAWQHITTMGVDHVFHLEDDFTFNQYVPLHRLIGILDRHPDIIQVALRRQAWNDEERAAGGLIEVHPDAYTDHVDDTGDHYLTHRLFFTTNPGVYRASLCTDGWPQTDHSEGIFTHQLLTDPYLRFAFWGRRNDVPHVHHIGAERVGCGY